MVISWRNLVLLLQLAVAMEAMLTPALSLPSSRVVYYLHTHPATWNEASRTCSNYGAVLVTMPEFNSTYNRLQYVDTRDWKHALRDLQQKFWVGLYRNSTGDLRWEKCTDYDSSAPLPEVQGTGSCYVSTSALTLSGLQCNARRPYICQRDDGQCWFQPYVNRHIRVDDVNSHTTSHTREDTADCAKLCQSLVEQERECWAFSFGESGSCELHFSEVNHKYALFLGTDDFEEADDFTAYVKICTGGYKTSLEPTVTDSRPVPRDENCTVIGSVEWDSSVCYCECDQPPIILQAEILVMTIEEKVEKIVKELQVDPQNTSSTRRKKISIEDSRPSAQGIGYFGIVFLVFIFGGIFLMDVNVLYIHVAKLCKSVKSDTQSDA